MGIEHVLVRGAGAASLCSALVLLWEPIESLSQNLAPQWQWGCFLPLVGCLVAPKYICPPPNSWNL